MWISSVARAKAHQPLRRQESVREIRAVASAQHGEQVFAIVKRAWWAPCELSDRGKMPLWYARSRYMVSRTDSRSRSALGLAFVARCIQTHRARGNDRRNRVLVDELTDRILEQHHKLVE